MTTADRNPVRALSLMPPGEEMFAGDFLEWPALTELAFGLITEHDELVFIQGYEIDVLWKRKGGEKNGSRTLGKCVLPKGLVRHYSRKTWVIWLAADHVRALKLNAKQVEALLYHELKHCHLDEGEPTVIGHDLEMFLSEIDRYGFWESDIAAAAEVFGRQLRLMEEDGK